jgi:hypothetical protein
MLSSLIREASLLAVVLWSGGVAGAQAKPDSLILLRVPAHFGASYTATLSRNGTLRYSSYRRGTDSLITATWRITLRRGKFAGGRNSTSRALKMSVR